MAWLAREAPDTALAAIVTAASALWWPDDVVGKAANFCRCVFVRMRHGPLVTPSIPVLFSFPEAARKQCYFLHVLHLPTCTSLKQVVAVQQQ